VVLNDGLAEFQPRARVAITVDVFSVENTFMDSLMATINATEKAANPVTMDKASITTDGSSVSLGAVLGNLPTSFIKLQLDIGRERGVRKMKNHFSLIVPNMTTLNYSKTQVLYRETKSGVGGQDEKIGLSVSGVVNINGLNTEMVQITNFNITYGVPTNDERSLVNAVTTSVATVDLLRGKSTMISLDELEVDEVIKKNAFIFGGGRKKSQGKQHLLMIISATPIPPMGM
ncbi:MAG: hypothetical protein AAB250_10130, partial [Bdellovibrionota bacterium]